MGMGLVFCCSLALADGLQFNLGWSRATVPGARTAAIYGQFKNDSAATLSVQKITSELAGMIMIHRSVLEDGMMKMRHIGEMSVSPGETIIFEPGGLHLMASGLKRSLNEKESFIIEISASDGTSRRAIIAVGSISQMMAPD
jgi:hypothetical protein